MIGLFCYTVIDDKTGDSFYGVTRTRSHGFGTGTRLARMRGLTDWTVTVHEVTK